ncbi:hypothetical protein AB1N83_005037 [Pleurotus pulmonarius]
MTSMAIIVRCLGFVRSSARTGGKLGVSTAGIGRIAAIQLKSPRPRLCLLSVFVSLCLYARAFAFILSFDDKTQDRMLLVTNLGENRMRVSVEWVADVTINGRVNILFNMTDMTRTTSMFEQQFSITAFGTSMGRWDIGYLLAE